MFIFLLLSLVSCIFCPTPPVSDMTWPPWTRQENLCCHATPHHVSWKIFCSPMPNPAHLFLKGIAGTIVLHASCSELGYPGLLLFMFPVLEWMVTVHPHRPCFLLQRKVAGAAPLHVSPPEEGHLSHSSSCYLSVRMVAVHSPMAIFPVSKVSWAAPLHVPCPQGCLPFIPLGQILCHWGIFCSFVYYYKEGPLLFMFPENGCCSPSLTMFSVLENGHVPRTSGWLPFILLSSRCSVPEEGHRGHTSSCSLSLSLVVVYTPWPCFL